MPFPLRPQEMAFYPQPFVESEVHLLVITNQRVVQFGDQGKQEIEARQVGFVGRVSERPMLIAGALLAVVGVPMLLAGAYLLLAAKGGVTLPVVPGQPPAAQPAPAAVNDDPAGPAADDPAAPPAALPSPGDPAASRGTAIVLALVGFVIAAAGALLATRQRHIVLVRAGAQVMKLRAANRMEQTQILSTLQAVQQAGKASAAPVAAPAQPPIKVDDGGDPVKALQELAQKRAAGKISDDDFVAKRAVLLERVKSRS